MQSELQQQPRMARRAPAEMHKCSEPYETHGLSERLPRLARSLPPPRPPRGLLPRPPPRLGAAGARNLPLPPHTLLSPRPSSPLLPPHPPTHPLAGSRLTAHARTATRSRPFAQCTPGTRSPQPRGNRDGRGKVAAGIEGVWAGLGELASRLRPAERRAPSHFLALALPGVLLQSRPREEVKLTRPR